MNRLFPLFLLVLLGMAGVAGAADLTPLATRNQSPLVQIYGLPAAAPATVLAPRQSAVSLTEDVASNNIEVDGPNESLLLDGETYRTTLRLRHGLPGGGEIGLAIPYIVQTGGFLDGFIIDWHNTFGLPQGGRNEEPRNRLLYRYQRGNSTPLLLDSRAAGLGDIVLTGGWQLPASSQSNTFALRASLKLPTGDADKLLGSGSTDLALWLCASHRFSTASLYAAAGALGMSDGEVLRDQQRHVVGFGTLGAAWGPLSWLALKLQVDGHTAFYNSTSLEELGGNSLQLNIGGTLGRPGGTLLDLAVGEDLIVDTAPDVVFHLALRRQF